MESGVAKKCLAFCQALSSSNHKFTLNLSIGKDNFNFCNKELAISSSACKKRKSPSQLRREQKRKLERNAKQQFEATERVTDMPAKSKNYVVSESEEANIYDCSKCEMNFKTEKGLNIHVGKAHKSETPSTPEKERSSSTQDISLVIAPVQAERAILMPENGQLVCTECGDFWGPATSIALGG